MALQLADLPTPIPGDDDGREDARDLDLRRSDFAGREKHRRTAPLKLGVLTFVSSEGKSPREALTEALDLFVAAEQLGYDLGLVRVRHLQPFLSGPVSFLSAASQRTSTLRLGTGVIPFHVEDPIRLAEELLTLDLLSAGRAEIGVSAAGEGPPSARTHWNDRDNSKPAVWERIAEFLSHLEGTALERVPGGRALPGIATETPITVTPHSPGLRDRVWGGPGSLASVEKTAEHRLKLQISSLNTEDVGLRFEPQQYEQIARYRELTEQLHPGAAGEVNVSRNIFPLTGGPDDEVLDVLGKYYSGRLYADGLHRVNTNGPFTARYSHPATGRVDDVIDHLRSDVGVSAGDNLVVLAPSDLDFDGTVRLLKLIADEIAPAIR